MVLYKPKVADSQKSLSVKLSSNRLTFVANTAYSGLWAAVHTQCVQILVSVLSKSGKVLLCFCYWYQLILNGYLYFHEFLEKCLLRM